MIIIPGGSDWGKGLMHVMIYCPVYLFVVPEELCYRCNTDFDIDQGSIMHLNLAPITVITMLLLALSCEPCVYISVKTSAC